MRHAEIIAVLETVAADGEAHDRSPALNVARPTLNLVAGGKVQRLVLAPRQLYDAARLHISDSPAVIEIRMNQLQSDLPVNLFDLAVYVCLAFAIIAGFRSGLLRSLATIFGYVIAAPVAVALMPYLTPIITERFHLPPAQTSLAFFVVFFVIGFVLAALLRGAVGEIAGPQIGARRPRRRRFSRRHPRRLAGGADGAGVRAHHSARARTRLSSRNRSCGRSCRRPASRACASCRPTSPISSTGSSANAAYSRRNLNASAEHPTARAIFAWFCAWLTHAQRPVQPTAVRLRCHPNLKSKPRGYPHVQRHL